MRPRKYPPEGRLPEDSYGPKSRDDQARRGFTDWATVPGGSGTDWPPMNTDKHR
jgi:hypothetical protein